MDKVLLELSAEISSRSDWALKKVKNNELLNKLLDESMKKIFSNSFYSKIQKEVKKKITIREANLLDIARGRYLKGAVAFVAWGPLGTSTIYIDKKYLEKRDKKYLIKILVHELIHVFQSKKKFFIFFRKFPELRDNSIELEDLIDENLKEGVDIAQFFGYKKGRSLGMNEHEVIAYIISSPNKPRLNLLAPGGKAKLIKGLKSFNMFNLKSKYWKERLKI